MKNVRLVATILSFFLVEYVNPYSAFARGGFCEDQRFECTEEERRKEKNKKREQHGSVSAQLDLPRTREPGRGVPRCGNPNAQTTADEVVGTIGGAIDAALSSYTYGVPVVSAIFAAVPDVVSWIKGRLGANDGPSACGTMCVAYPSTTPGEWFVDASEGGNTGRLRTVGEQFSIGWARLDDITHRQTTKGNTVTCASVRHWKHDRDRTFVLKVSY